MNVLNKIEELRKCRGITQVKLAEDLNVSRQTINAIEKHKYNPSLELSLKISEYFDVKVEELFKLVTKGEVKR
ncbi:helix-turn-helix transcriptional regulator [Shouchella hunanensis]|uniref:Helix-turn-helix transcriptional regulator n=1 Tax=Shouchella hunanensis TaxID=766894 RepID=A0ABY7W3L3_9BACI|nr:helix-turn-helix transcriptional regulator [Shouchella hunanensis]WDF02053.1 helix-turn-helix transcriptional regulator [Shouchella hunanensis]GAF24470.1 uncharacterized HTH-type transcriptional regulator [Bacillus sp. JCM 19047]